METATTEQLPREQLARVYAARVLLRMQGGDSAGFFVSTEGHIVASLHAVSGEDEITAVLPDGWELPVTGVCAVDPRRDIVILKVDGLGFPVLPIATPAAVREGQAVYAYDTRAGPAVHTVGAVHVLERDLQLFELQGALPTESNGSPVLNGDGEGVGFMTAGRGAVGATSVGIPLKHVLQLIRPGEVRPVSALRHLGARRQVVRDVPHHPVEMLDGCELSAVQRFILTLMKVIQQGAPVYNRGEVEACFKLYQDAALRLCEQHAEDCPPLVAAMRVGLTRAGTMDTVDEKVWALRDAFDGLLDVARRYFHAQQLPVRPTVGAVKRYVN